MRGLSIGRLLAKTAAAGKPLGRVAAELCLVRVALNLLPQVFEHPLEIV